MKNWRPITLLNTLYKIDSGTLANRIKTVVSKIINSDQTGLKLGRYIGENARLIYDIMHYTEENNIPGTLLMIDFEKGFDSVSWNFIQKSLQFLCRLRSIATHRDHFVRRPSARPSVCLSLCPSVTLFKAMFSRRHMHSSECCHYFIILAHPFKIGSK